MRLPFFAAYLANLAVTLGSLPLLPDRIATHFGARGLPDDWGSKESNALLLVGVHTLLFALLYLSPRLVMVVPPRFVNLPHKEYWLRPENRPVTIARLSVHLGRMGTALFLFMLVGGVLVLQANLAEPVRLNMPLFLGALGVFLAYTVGWCVCFYRAFRVPAGPAAGTAGV